MHDALSRKKKEHAQHPHPAHNDVAAARIDIPFLNIKEKRIWPSAVVSQSDVSPSSSSLPSSFLPSPSCLCSGQDGRAAAGRRKGPRAPHPARDEGWTCARQGAKQVGIQIFNYSHHQIVRQSVSLTHCWSCQSDSDSEWPIFFEIIHRTFLS